ncbi:MAG: DUF1566 domain-containing protein, partial [Gammaproteobacteria bacterium]|nr:DUF1566 domain-containing protein [Gammaproteobacteria bacterium]
MRGISVAILKHAILYGILSISISNTFADQCDSTVPGHYPDRYIDNNDGTISDKMTGLMWSKCIMGMTWDGSRNLCISKFENGQEKRAVKLNWQDSLKYVTLVNASNYLNYSDWRLPNIKELASILDVACLANLHAMALDLDYFDVYTLSSDHTSATTTYWSSTPHRVTLVDTDN